MNTLVVGGAGFIGSHLVDRLLADGHSVDVVDDLSSGALANLAEARAAHGALRISTLDATAPPFADLVALRRPEVIYLLAPLVPGVVEPRRLVEPALAVTVAVLEAARHVAGTKVVALLPGASLYGDVPAREQPIKEGRGWSPVDVRGVAARAVLDLLQVYRDAAQVEFTVLVTGCVYGTRQRADGGVVAALRAAALAGRAPVLHGDGRQARDLLFIDDAVDALSRAADRAGGLIVNVGSGTPTTIRDLWQAVAASLGLAPADAEARLDPAGPGGVARLVLSPTRARIHLGWEPWTGLADGLAQLAQEA